MGRMDGLSDLARFVLKNNSGLGKKMKTSFARLTIGLALRTLTAVSGLFLGMLASAATLEDISYTTLPGDQVEVKLTFDGQVPDPRGYSIEKPARIALDLPATKSSLTTKYHSIGSANARSITVVEAKDRTRLIFNLVQLQNYETRKEGNSLVVLLGAEAASVSTDPVASADTPRNAGQNGLTAVDFRRGPQGEGQVVVTLSSPSVPVDITQQGGKVIAKFVGAQLPEQLRRRLDVTDFATPVSFIDARYDGQHTTVTVEPQGEWEYMAFQADNRFTINVKPVSDTETAKREKDAFEYTGEKLSLSFQDIEVRSVLQLIADFTSLNLVASDTVSGRITLRLQNVPWDQALDLVLKTKGLDKRKVGNVLLVAPADEIAAREQLELESLKKIEELAPLRTEFLRVNYARAEDMEALIKSDSSLLTSRGSLTVDQRTNTLIVQDTENKLEEIRELIAVLDIQVQQVLIEARVVVATTDVAKAMGVRWGGIGTTGGLFGQNRTVAFTGRSGQFQDFAEDRTSDEDSFEFTDPLNAVVDLGVADSAASRFTLGFIGDNNLIDVELSALDTEGSANLVATPKVLTADQQPAIIASGTEFGFETATSSGATALEFKDAELRLEVTPSITPDGKVLMAIKINNDSLSGFQGPIPILDTNRIETSVLVKDGETVVLGGIFQENKSNEVAKTPFLGDLPFIGRLFRRDTKRNDKNELLIFITPRLVQDSVAGR